MHDGECECVGVGSVYVRERLRVEVPPPVYNSPMAARWPLHDIATANIVRCMVHKRGRVGVVYCALVVQQYCDRVSNADGGGNTRVID